MSAVVNDVGFGSLCRPYWRNWGQSPNSEILRTVPNFALVPHQGSGGEWLPGEGSSELDQTRIRHLRCLTHSSPYGFGNVAAASGPHGFGRDLSRTPSGRARRLKPAALLELTKPLWELGQSTDR